MGNKTKGRAIANLNNVDYMFAMGATNANLINTGIDFTNYAVYKYFKILRNYALMRIKWSSPQLNDRELNLIEWFIFHFGRCAMVRPRIIIDGGRFTLPLPRVYRCVYTCINRRTGDPEKISLVDSQNNHAIIDVNYGYNEFVIFTDEFTLGQDPMPFRNIAWEYACKLYELDLAFNANSHKLRMPFVFNSSSLETEINGNTLIGGNNGPGLSELMRSAYGRNEQFIEVPESMVGTQGFLHEPKNNDNHMLEHLEAQKRLYQAYFELLGLYTSRDKAGVYTVKKLQENGDESPDYITETLKTPRILCAAHAAKMFNINIEMEVI